MTHPINHSNGGNMEIKYKNWRWSERMTFILNKIEELAMIRVNDIIIQENINDTNERI